MSTRNDFLNAMRDAGGADEEYTAYETVAAGLSHVAGLLRGKSVYCNCDNPFTSQFVAWLASNFERLGIKRLEATCLAGHMEQETLLGKPATTDDGRDGEDGAYVEQESFLNERHVDGTAWHAVVTNAAGADWTMDRGGLERLYRMPGNSVGKLAGDGGFESKECMEILGRCDVALTNPPFSRFRTFLRTLVARGKEFAIIGDLNAASYRYVFELLRAGTIWLGPEPAYWFRDARGNRFRLKSGVWYTNMGARPESRVQAANGPVAGWATDVDGILDVPRLNEFPVGYGGQIGVPLSWLQAPDPDYELVDVHPLRIRHPDGRIRRTYQRLIIRRKDGGTRMGAPQARTEADDGWQLSFDLAMDDGDGNDGPAGQHGGSQRCTRGMKRRKTW